MTERRFKRSDRVMVTIRVPGTLNAETNEKNPSGKWWVQIDGRISLTAIDEREMSHIGGAPGEEATPAKEG